MDEFGDYLEFIFESQDGEKEFKLKQYDTPRVYDSRAKFKLGKVMVIEHCRQHTIYSEEGMEANVVYELYWEHDHKYFTIIGIDRKMLLEQIQIINRL